MLAVVAGGCGHPQESDRDRSGLLDRKSIESAFREAGEPLTVRFDARADDSRSEVDVIYVPKAHDVANPPFQLTLFQTGREARRNMRLLKKVASSKAVFGRKKNAIIIVGHGVSDRAPSALHNAHARWLMSTVTLTVVHEVRDSRWLLRASSALVVLVCSLAPEEAPARPVRREVGTRALPASAGRCQEVGERVEVLLAQIPIPPHRSVPELRRVDEVLDNEVLVPPVSECGEVGTAELAMADVPVGVALSAELVDEGDRTDGLFTAGRSVFDPPLDAVVPPARWTLTGDDAHSCSERPRAICLSAFDDEPPPQPESERRKSASAA